MSIADVMRSLRQAMSTIGPYALRDLRNMFLKVDYSGSKLTAHPGGQLDQEDVRWVFKNTGIELLEQEVAILVGSFEGQPGLMDYRGFFQSLVVSRIYKSTPAPHRVQIIRDVYSAVAEKLNGKVTIEQLARLFDANRHPDVKAGKRNQKQVFDEFVRGWGEANPVQPLPEPAFVAYYLVFPPLPRMSHSASKVTSCLAN